MPSELRRCPCGMAMNAMTRDGEGLDAALFLCARCDIPPTGEASWIQTYWARRLSERGGA